MILSCADAFAPQESNRHQWYSILLDSRKKHLCLHLQTRSEVKTGGQADWPAGLHAGFPLPSGHETPQRRPSAGLAHTERKFLYEKQDPVRNPRALTYAACHIMTLSYNRHA